MLEAGTLLLVVGASGAGKDTLVQWARRELPREAKLAIVEREITRSAGNGEHHVEVTPQELARRREAGHYLLHWRAHGVDYGIPRSACEQLERGRSVLSIASRAILPAARALPYPARFIEIRAPLAVLERRLYARGGRPGAEIAERVARAGAFTLEGPDVHVIDNGGEVSDSGAAFVALLLRLAGP